MAKITKTENDRFLRENVFASLFGTIPFDGTDFVNVAGYPFHRINDRQWGIILIDKNGDERYIRVGAIVAELREDMTAQELMDTEIAEYNAKQEAKAEKAKKKEAKIIKDKAKREAEAKAKEEQTNA
jgi:topoisomerase IA-like protein